MEVKRTTAPTITASMKIAMKDLELDHLYVVHAGDTSFPMAEKIEAVAARELRLRLAR